MFVVGPMREIFPRVFTSVNPEMMTAPGDIILKSGEIIDISVSAVLIRFSLNSAQSPFLCAAVLWAISWVRKDVVRIVVNAASVGRFWVSGVIGKSASESPARMTSVVAAVRCLVSVLLKCVFLVLGAVSM